MTGCSIEGEEEKEEGIFSVGDGVEPPTDWGMEERWMTHVHETHTDTHTHTH